MRVGHWPVFEMVSFGINYKNGYSSTHDAEWWAERRKFTSYSTAYFKV
jgi:hypothetical protein